MGKFIELKYDRATVWLLKVAGKGWQWTLVCDGLQKRDGEYYVNWQCARGNAAQAYEALTGKTLGVRHE